MTKSIRIGTIVGLTIILIALATSVYVSGGPEPEEMCLEVVTAAALVREATMVQAGVPDQIATLPIWVADGVTACVGWLEAATKNPERQAQIRDAATSVLEQRR